jgi:hypothetical protein
LVVHNSFNTCRSLSDKLHRHGYHRYYDVFLSRFISAAPEVLEIGVDDLYSIDLWQEYFRNPIITVIDILEKTVPSDVTFIQCDQSSLSDLKSASNTFKRQFDVIVDDGSHVPEHQYLTLRIFWDSLAPGGVYIIEDIETSYWGKSSLFGYAINSNRFSLINKMLRCVDVVNEEFSFLSKNIKKQALYKVAHEIDMIAFGANCVVITKKNPASYGSFYDREYELKDKVNERRLLTRVFRKLMWLFHNTRNP